MVNGVYQELRNSATCARNCERTKRKRHFKLLHAFGLLKFVVMDILGPLPWTKKENEFIVVMTYRCSKIKRAIPTSKTTATNVANVFLDQCIVPYGIPDYSLADNGPEFVSKFLATLCTFLGLKNLTTTAYHPQTSGQVEWYTKTIVKCILLTTLRRRTPE